MWISKKKWNELQKRTADLEVQVQDQQIFKSNVERAFRDLGVNFPQAYLEGLEQDERFDEEAIVSKCFTKDFARMIQLFRILTEKLDFSQPFRAVIEYDPEQLRVKTSLYEPTEVLQRYIEKVQGKVKD